LQGISQACGKSLWLKFLVLGELSGTKQQLAKSTMVRSWPTPGITAPACTRCPHAIISK